MSFAKRKEICLWVVGARDGKVHKVRFSLTTLVIALCAGILVGSGFLFIASDYARVQLSRAQTFFHLKRLNAERDSLLTRKAELKSRVKSLENQSQKAASYEEQIEARLDELAALLKSSDPAGVLGRGQGFDRKGSPQVGDKRLARNPKATTYTSKEGMGGAELDCLGKDRERCLQEFGMDDQMRARFQPSSLRLGATSLLQRQPTSREDLLERLDGYIEILRFAPIGMPTAGHVTSGFGYRNSPFHGGLRMHEGIDFSVPQGAMIMSTGDGIVQQVRLNPTYGLVVDVVHSDRLTTRYAHLSKIFVREGEKICRGEVLGLAGTTGRSTGPHLHYEVLVDGHARDPEPFVELAGLLAQLLKDQASA